MNSTANAMRMISMPMCTRCATDTEQSTNLESTKGYSCARRINKSRWTCNVVRLPHIVVILIQLDVVAKRGMPVLVVSVAVGGFMVVPV